MPRKIFIVHFWKKDLKSTVKPVPFVCPLFHNFTTLAPSQQVINIIDIINISTSSASKNIESNSAKIIQWPKVSKLKAVKIIVFTVLFVRY